MSEVVADAAALADAAGLGGGRHRLGPAGGDPGHPAHPVGRPRADPPAGPGPRQPAARPGHERGGPGRGPEGLPGRAHRPPRPLSPSPCWLRRSGRPARRFGDRAGVRRRRGAADLLRRARPALRRRGRRAGGPGPGPGDVVALTLASGRRVGRPRRRLRQGRARHRRDQPPPGAGRAAGLPRPGRAGPGRRRTPTRSPSWTADGARRPAPRRRPRAAGRRRVHLGHDRPAQGGRSSATATSRPSPASTPAWRWGDPGAAPTPMLAATQMAHVGFTTKLAWYLRTGTTTHLLDRWRAADVLGAGRAGRPAGPRRRGAPDRPAAARPHLRPARPVVGEGPDRRGRAVAAGAGRGGPPALRGRLLDPLLVDRVRAGSAPAPPSTPPTPRPSTPWAAPRGGIEVAIHDDDGRPVPDGEAGEVWLRSDAATDGYLHDDDGHRRAAGARRLAPHRRPGAHRAPRRGPRARRRRLPRAHRPAVRDVHPGRLQRPPPGGRGRARAPPGRGPGRRRAPPRPGHGRGRRGRRGARRPGGAALAGRAAGLRRRRPGPPQAPRGPRRPPRPPPHPHAEARPRHPEGRGRAGSHVPNSEQPQTGLDAQARGGRRSRVTPRTDGKGRSGRFGPRMRALVPALVLAVAPGQRVLAAGPRPPAEPGIAARTAIVPEERSTCEALAPRRPGRGGHATPASLERSATALEVAGGRRTTRAELQPAASDAGRGLPGPAGRGRSSDPRGLVAVVVAWFNTRCGGVR